MNTNFNKSDAEIIKEIKESLTIQRKDSKIHIETKRKKNDSSIPEREDCFICTI